MNYNRYQVIKTRKPNTGPLPELKTKTQEELDNELKQQFIPAKKEKSLKDENIPSN